MLPCKVAPHLVSCLPAPGAWSHDPLTSAHLSISAQAHPQEHLSSSNTCHGKHHRPDPNTQLYRLPARLPSRSRFLEVLACVFTRSCPILFPAISPPCPSFPLSCAHQSHRQPPTLLHTVVLLGPRFLYPVSRVRKFTTPSLKVSLFCPWLPARLTPRGRSSQFPPLVSSSTRV